MVTCIPLPLRLKNFHRDRRDVQTGALPGNLVVFSSRASSAMLSVAAAAFLEGLMASKRARRSRAWSKEDVRELKAHSRSKSPVKKIAKAMKRTVGALRQKALSPELPLGHRR
jgi:hypothetical protein